MTQRVLGINRTQDASICLIEDGRVRFLVQKERLNRQKHAWGTLGDIALYKSRLPELAGPIDLVVECYSSDRQYAKLPEYRAELLSELEFSGTPRVELVSHHLAHTYSAFFPSGASDAAVLIADFQGSRVGDSTEAWSGREQADPSALEVASFYQCAPGGIRCLAKQLWDGDRARPRGLGAFYYFLTSTIFGSGSGQEGKVMGLAPLGNERALDLPPLTVEGHEVLIPEPWREIFADRTRYRFSQEAGAQLQRSADLAAAGQRAFEEALLRLCRWLRASGPSAVLCYAGGCALNCSANGRLRAEKIFERVFVPPCPGDGGTALGCAVYGSKALLQSELAFSWCSSDYLGPTPVAPDLQLIRPHLDALDVAEVPDLDQQAARLLAGGAVVAIWQGRSESGPRALGHRSILADPRKDSTRLWINRAIKGRELFRPLAPMVLAERAAEYFQADEPLPFMQFAVSVQRPRQQEIAAVTHVDGSARIQTVAADGDPLVRKILEAFERATGVPVLLNTSFNGKEEPIVESFGDALSTFLKLPIDAMVAPPFVITKKVRATRPLPGDPSDRQR
jgi:carbamoyltransferase